MEANHFTTGRLTVDAHHALLSYSHIRSTPSGYVVRWSNSPPKCLYPSCYALLSNMQQSFRTLWLHNQSGNFPHFMVPKHALANSQETIFDPWWARWIHFILSECMPVKIKWNTSLHSHLPCYVVLLLQVFLLKTLYVSHTLSVLSLNDIKCYYSVISIAVKTIS